MFFHAITPELSKCLKNQFHHVRVDFSRKEICVCAFQANWIRVRCAFCVNFQCANCSVARKYKTAGMAWYHTSRVKMRNTFSYLGSSWYTSPACCFNSLQIFETTGFSNTLLSELFVGIPDSQVTADTLELDTLQFSCHTTVSHSHEGVGSGTLPLSNSILGLPAGSGAALGVTLLSSWSLSSWWSLLRGQASPPSTK